MNLSRVLLILLVIIGAVMIYLGVKANIYPPTLTGVGFFIIAWLLHSKK